MIPLTPGLVRSQNVIVKKFIAAVSSSILGHSFERETEADERVHKLQLV